MMLASPRYIARHSLHLRVPLTLFDWLIAKADEAQIPPASYARKRLEELAQQDVLKGDHDGPDAA